MPEENSKKWKKHLLGSSLPLEYEIAKLLVKEKFVVKSDFTYNRKSEGTTKEFSVDIQATCYVPCNKASFEARLNFLIECKHRSPEKKWFFITEPNEPDFSPFVCAAFRVFDRLSAYSMPSKNLVAIDLAMPGVYKGTEVSLADSSVSDTDIKSGINQLRYALPELIARELWENGTRHPVDSVPFILSAILVTNAEIFVAKEKLTMEAVKKASNLEQIANKEDYIVIYSSGGPDFQSHLHGVVTKFALSEWLKDKGQIFDWRERAQGKNTNAHVRKDSWIRGFEMENFTHFIVCSFDAFPKLIKDIKAAVNKDLKKRKFVFTKKEMDALLLDRVRKSVGPLA